MPTSVRKSNEPATWLAVRLPDTAFTRSGVAFQPNEDVWDWSDGPFHLHVDFLRVQGQFVELRGPLKSCLLVYVKGHSAHYVQNLFQAFQHFTSTRDPEPPFVSISVAEVSNYAARLQAHEPWRLGTLNVLLQKWSALGLPGVDAECVEYLGARRKPGNEKGAAVRTRDPVHGPFSADEYTALYKAVDAAYGTGEIPHWAAILSRLLFACGGRISQYASLKLMDMVCVNGTFVLSLPQAKTREAHSRMSFKSFNLSPQTGRLIQGFVDDLLLKGHGMDSPMFHESTVMASGTTTERRESENLFFGHCTAATLSRVISAALKRVAPTTERLGFGPLPVSPQRFRYTFGTRLVEEGEAAKRNESEPSFPQPFLSFAKAFIVYLQSQRPVVSYGQRLSALRCLEAALREWNKGSRPTAVNVEVLDTAVELAKKRFTADVAYRVAGQLKLISGLMHSTGVIALRQTWTHGMNKPADLGSRISKESLDARQQKLPSAAALRALGGIFCQATSPADILISSYTALMLCAPERINEVLRLRRNCLVEGEGRFVGMLGLRWPGSKLSEDTTKWLPTQMVPVAREAVSNILRYTSTAHELAVWYTANPDKLFLHGGASHLRGKVLLTPREIAIIFWGDDSLLDSAILWASETKKLASVSGGGRGSSYRFEDVERAVLAMLPKTFPYLIGDAKLLCKDAMAVVRVNDMDSKKSAFLCMFRCLDINAITQPLGRTGHSSVFERFAYTEDDGTPIVLRSHSLRHYLNMLAQMGGLSSAEIAIFSGRKDERQNRAYDHMTSDEVQAPISEALKTGFMGTLVPASSRDLVERHEFKNKGTGAAHTTEFGWCMHNFASEPCQMHRDCVNCEEQECIKGEAHKEANLRQLKEETQYLLQQAREALTEKEYGADNWVKHQAQTLDRVSTLLSIMDDAAIPQGARVRLNLANAPLITADTVQPIKVIRNDRRKALQ